MALDFSSPEFQQLLLGLGGRLLASSGRGENTAQGLGGAALGGLQDYSQLQRQAQFSESNKLRNEALQRQFDRQDKQQERREKIAQQAGLGQPTGHPGVPPQQQGLGQLLAQESIMSGDMGGAANLLGLGQEGVDPTGRMQDVAAGLGQQFSPELLGNPAFQQAMQVQLAKKQGTTVNVGDRLMPGMINPRKVPTGFMVDKAGTNVVPIPGVQEKDRNERLEVISNVEGAVGKYKSLIEGMGPQFSVGPFNAADTAKLKGEHTNVLMQMKELYNLGVLNGPDLEVMLGVLGDPTTVGAATKGAAPLLEGIKVVEGELERRRQSTETRFSTGFSKTQSTKDSSPSSMSDEELLKALTGG